MTAPATPAPASGSRWEDFIEIFVAPGRVFARRERSSFVVPLLLLVVVLTALFYLTMPLLQSVFDGEFARGAARAMTSNPKLTPEMMAQGKAMQEKVSGVIVLIIIPIAVTLVAGSMWLLGRLVGSAQRFGAAMVVATFAFYPRIVESIVAALQGAVLPDSQLTSRASLSVGAARFLDPDTTSPIVMALGLRADLFTLWVTVLIGVGLRVTGKLSTANAALVAVLVYLLGGLLPLLFALRAG